MALFRYRFRSRRSPSAWLGFVWMWWGLISGVAVLVLLALGFLDRLSSDGRHGLVPSARGLPDRGFVCGLKRYCGEMSGCAEARFYFTQCGLSRLDADRDGVPCETLCRRG